MKNRRKWLLFNLIMDKGSSMVRTILYIAMSSVMLAGLDGPTQTLGPNTAAAYFPLKDFHDRKGRAPDSIRGVPMLGDTTALVGHRIMPYVDRVVITVKDDLVDIPGGEGFDLFAGDGFGHGVLHDAQLHELTDGLGVEVAEEIAAFAADSH